MTTDDILAILKIDLGISSTALDSYLTQLIQAAQGYIEEEGITLTESVPDGQLVEMYAAWLYRKRREENAPMPRMLRWNLNNRLMAQKGTVAGNG